MTDPAPVLTVVIPAFNEENRLGTTLERIHSWLSGRAETFEILVVDDGSRDRTVALVREFAGGHPGVRLHEAGRNRGKGAAVRTGFAESRGERVLFSDADLSTPIEELVPMQEALNQGAGLVIASRDLPESNLAERQAWYREGMGKLFNRIVRMATGIPFRDTQCGFKLLGGGDARALATEMREDGFAFDVELILLARRSGLAIRELPVTWRHVDESRVSPVTDALRMLQSLPRILRRTGRYRV
ncbi:MAG: glycosyltransferase family 2 protein [Gemmatimonadetes bacterium]|nr:glycosyltransferase family 2 protein [Gemmatimonadota bacterium]